MNFRRFSFDRLELRARARCTIIPREFFCCLVYANAGRNTDNNCLWTVVNNNSVHGKYVKCWILNAAIFDGGFFYGERNLIFLLVFLPPFLPLFFFTLSHSFFCILGRDTVKKQYGFINSVFIINAEVMINISWITADSFYFKFHFQGFYLKFVCDVQCCVSCFPSFSVFYKNSKIW